MSLSAVIVTHNSGEVLGGCLASLRAHLPVQEIIVVDNASTEGPPAPPAEDGAVTVIANERNAGYGRACNQGARRARGSHVVFVNPDIEIAAVDGERLAAELERRPFGLMGPVLSTGRLAEPGVYRHKHWTQDLLDQVAGPLRPRELPRLPRLPARRGSRWLSGAMLFAAREEFLDLGGFDERFFLYYEDRDLGRRYAAARLPIGLTAALTVRHQLAHSSAGPAAGLDVRIGWSYLSWLQYLYIWHGRGTAERAARVARALQVALDRGLAALALAGPLNERVARKRAQLQATRAFVSLQRSFGEGSAPSDYCPEGREIAARV